MSRDAACRVGIIGLGKMGLLHAAIYNSLPGSRVVAVAEPQRFSRDGLHQLQPGMRVFERAREMLGAVELDAVVITTPVSDHVPSALECVARDLPFFMEKPLAASASQAAELVEALRARRLLNMVGFMTRFIDSFERGKALVDSGCLGRLHRVTGTIYVSQLFSRGHGWRYDRRTAGGGVLLSQGSHLLDLLTWYFGPVARVNAQTVSPYSAEVEDSAHVMLEFRSGLCAWLDCSWSVRFRRTVETTIEISGDEGSLTITDDTVRVFLERAAGGVPQGLTTFEAPELYRSVPVDVGGPQYTREAQAFLDAWRRGGGRVQPSVTEALHVQQIVDAAYDSAARSGAPVSIT